MAAVRESQPSVQEELTGLPTRYTLAMPIFGLDISHHQDLALDLARCKREGISFVFIKSTEGSTYVDPEFAHNLAEARGSGLEVAAYHYVRSNATAAAQIENVKRAVPRGVPVIPDVEANSGGVALLREFVQKLREAGYRVPLTYLPRWYWQQLGSPDLSGLPPLWSSRYPDNVVGTVADEWADVPSRYWDGYGGLSVAVLQFTSSASIAGHQPLDANAYQGTLAGLQALLYGTQPPEDTVRNLILAQEPSGKVWVGDGLFRRHVADPDELAGVQSWIRDKGGDPTIHGPWADLRVLGTDVASRLGDLGVKIGDLSDDEANIISAFQQVTTPVVELTPEQVDQFANSVLSGLDPSVREAVRQAFARAGEPDTE